MRHLDAYQISEAFVDGLNPLHSTRKLTFVLYLNECWSGGQLRVFIPTNSPENYLDIDPSFGRLVVFRRWIHFHPYSP